MSCVDSTRLAPAVKEHFSAVLNRLQDDPRLKPRDIFVIASILRFARQKNWASMSNRTLANLGRCTERTIQLSLARLEAAGWIIRKSTTADIGSNTGRLIYLCWRPGETASTPPKAAIAPPAPTPIAPEVEQQEREEKPAPQSLDGSGPDGQTKTEPTPPSDPLDYAALGWLDRPASDPLRRIAEKTLAARLVGPTLNGSVVQAIKSPQPLLRTPGTLARMLGRQLGGR
jgi:hypothetical protein